MKMKYIDFGLTRKVPNKYNLTPKSIKELKVLDWDRLKEKCWHNNAMGGEDKPWWCHIEGCNDGGRYDDEDEFWIGFNESTGEVDCNFSSYGGMCHYCFDEFYNINDIYNKYDMMVQVNALRWLNKMINEGILGV